MTKHQDHMRRQQRRKMQPNNGTGEPPGIPPDMVWDEDNPPYIHMCSQYIEHLDGCDGSCEGMFTTENQVKIINESRAWARLGQVFHGIPSPMSGMVPGISVEIFDQNCRMQAIEELIVESSWVNREEIDDRHRRIKYEIMHELRMGFEEDLKKQQAQAIVRPTKPPIIGPHGEILG